MTDVLAAESLRVDTRLTSSSISFYLIAFSNGNLILEKPLNEAVSSNFSVVISAKIGGGQENFAVIHVKKRLLNRHVPKFLFDEYRFLFDPEIREVGSVYAFDIDDGDNGKIVYSILSGNEDDYFKLDKDSGGITIQNASDSISSDFTLTIRALDSSKLTPLSSTCTVYLKKMVKEETISSPKFEKSVFIRRV